jgi:tetratricopeptide (TPR) repeat protein
MEHLVADYAAVSSHRQLLAVYLHNLAEMLQNMGRDKEAEEGYRQAITHLERVIQADPQGLGKSFYTQAILGDSLGRLGKLALKRCEPAEARRLLKRALGHVDTALKINPGNPMVQRWRLEFAADLAGTWLAQANHRQAAEIASELVGLDPQRPESHVESGRILARCAAVAMNEGERSASERAGRARRYADESFAALRRAVELGYSNHARWGDDPDLAAVHARSDFRDWYHDLIDRAFPIDPFAR